MPVSAATPWRSQRPLFSQLGHTWLPSANSSPTICRLSCARSSAATSTTAPSCTGIVQAATTRPSTRAVQTRQVPSAGCSSWKHRVGT